MNVIKELFGNVEKEYKGPFQGKDFQITITNTGTSAADITDEEGIRAKVDDAAQLNEEI